LPPAGTDAAFSTLINPNSPGPVSAELRTAHPLKSQALFEYAAARYLTGQASEATKALSATSAGAEFSGDGASATYAYTTRYEDFAMLVEEVLMEKYHGIQRDTAFIEIEHVGTDAQGQAVNQPIVHWGQRGRIGDPLVQPRAQLAMEQLLPHREWATFFSALPAPRAMAASATWTDNLDLIGGNSIADAPSATARQRAWATHRDDGADPHH